MSLVTIPTSTSVEKLRATVYSSSDPTGGVVEWQLAAAGSAPAIGSWVAGTWSGSYASGKATAVSPLIASLGATAGRFGVWIRWTVGTETPERNAGELVIG